MAGKRLLDAANLFTAGRAITRQHFALRKEQWDLYTRTSSLAKAAKSQTDRVTVTARAAVDLAQRLNETRPPWQQAKDDLDTRRETFRRGTQEADVEPPLGGNNSANNAENAIKDAGSTNPPYGSDGDDGTLASLRKREHQRLAESQIPIQSAGDQPLSASKAGQDTFNQRSENVASELSSLPRTKLPKPPEEPLPPITQALNQDVFPSPDDEPPEGSSLNAFHSRKVAHMLGNKHQDLVNPYAGRQKLPPQPLPEMIEASERRRLKVPARGAAYATQQMPSRDVETHDLAASIVQDVQSQETGPPDASESEAQAYEMHESRIPSTRIGRFWQYGGLATSMALGAVGESFRRFAGGSKKGSLMLSEGNVTRLVTKLSRMRGAALKLGQMISFQDSKVLPPTINTILQRVQDNADYMPAFQRNQVLVSNLGKDWSELFSHFEEKPFAAASIGQVHQATLKSNGKQVAIKIQYPGVRNSIDSDLNNLSLLLTASQLLPRGLFLDKTIANARTELGWECDYEREANACLRFQELASDEPETFAVPRVYLNASGPDVLTAEFMHGIAVTKIKDLSQSERDWIGTQVLRLCLRELMEWRFMQTDPNWTNFLYNRQTKKLELLDFGASRDFPDRFVEPYVSLLIAASKNDREACKDLSIQLGYLTGRESKEMLNSHVGSVMTLAEPFVETAPQVYDFEDQTITDRVRANIGLMLRERLAPPPEETYSLHRKLSGAFLLCARLKSKVPARDMFARAVERWNGRAMKVKL